MWNARVVVESVVEHGRRALHQLLRRQGTPRGQHLKQQQRQQYYSHKLSKGAGEGEGGAVGGCGASRAVGVASRLRPLTSQLVQGILRRVSAPLWTEARRRTTQRLVFGASAPYFALVGVTLEAGPQGLVTRDDELETLCCTVREAISRAGWLHDPNFWQSQKENVQHQEQQEHEVKGEHTYSLSDFILGPIIDKGCNAVVYGAKWNKGENQDDDMLSSRSKRQRSASPKTGEDKKKGVEALVYSQNFKELVQDFPHPRDERENVWEACPSLGDSSRDPTCTISCLQSEDHEKDIKANLMKNEQEDDLKSTGEYRPQGAIARTTTTAPATHSSSDTMRSSDLQEFPLAVKMMFNYEAESNAPAILRAMYKEILPARSVQLDQAQRNWQEKLCGPQVCLPPHPNVVEMPCVFVDHVPLLEGSLELYPQALPSRLNPRGYGRNMSLFCVMKRYDISLREYLSRYRPSRHTCLLLFTQLLEALLHLNSNNTAHRDLKSDNILLSLGEGWQYPLLVLADFGCSITGNSPSITIPFPCREADPRQGNPALMAPEVKNAVPGLLQSIPFGYCDVWAAGALSYEIYGLENPFCAPPNSSPRKKQKALDSATYKESQLPRLPKGTSPLVRHLVHDLLRRNPRVRPNVNIAATLCQLVLWAPSKWLCRHSLTLPTHTEVTQWLLCLATKVLCEARIPKVQTHDARESKRNGERGGNADHQGSQLEYQMVSTFLARVHYADIIQAIKWNRAF